MKYNKQQAEYLSAKKEYECLQAQEKEMEKNFILEKGIVNSDGTIPERTYAIDDDELFESVSEEFSKQEEESGLWSKICIARDNVRETEKALLDYALSIAPAGIRETLRNGAKQNYTIEQKLLETVIRLDTSTVNH